MKKWFRNLVGNSADSEPEEEPTELPVPYDYSTTDNFTVSNVTVGGTNISGFSGGAFTYTYPSWTEKTAECAHALEQLGLSERYRCSKCQMIVTIKMTITLATALREFYKRILDEPLSAAMMGEWAELQAAVNAVLEAAPKYLPLIDEEITSKIG
jgi:hypothetical protein